MVSSLSLLSCTESNTRFHNHVVSELENEGWHEQWDSHPVQLSTLGCIPDLDDGKETTAICSTTINLRREKKIKGEGCGSKSISWRRETCPSKTQTFICMQIFWVFSCYCMKQDPGRLRKRLLLLWQLKDKCCVELRTLKFPG